jgi:hypothetical protein
MHFPIVGPWGEKEAFVSPTLAAISVSFVATLGMAMFACHEAADVPCQDDSNCDLAPNGLCVAASSETRWCAYPDTTCSSGYRYSDLDVGDGVGATCAAGFSLRVAIGGSGKGTVTTSRGPLSCNNGVCEGSFPNGTSVTLTATASSGLFLGWSDGCRGQGECNLVMDRDWSIGALFGMPGQSLWVRQLGSTGNDQGAKLIADNDGNILATGIFSNTITIDNISLVSAGGTDFYVAKLNPTNGQVLWAKRFGGPGNDRATAIAVDASNDVYVAGQFENAVDFGGGTQTSSGSADAFVVKLASIDGNHVWSRTVGGTAFDGAQGLAVRGSAVVLTGVFAGSVTVDATTLTSAGQIDIFIVGLTTAGTTSWVKSFGGTGADSPRTVAIDSSGNVVLAGHFNSSMLIFTSALFNAGGDDGFFAKLRGSDGMPLLAKQFGSTGDDQALAVAIDTADNIYVVGAFRGSIDFGSGVPITATNQSDVFVAKYTLGGASQWAKSFGGTGSETGTATAVNAAGDLVIAGSFCGTISFGGAPLISATACSFTDAFVVRLSAADGSHQRSVRVGGMGSETADGVALDAYGRMYITGYFDGFAEFGGAPLTPVGLSDSYIAGFAPL